MQPQKELTWRGLLLGALITTVFTAANVYLGLKVGLTFASSIPAAVISMAVLSFVRDATILENNIVQTVASAAGTLSAIIFVLPGLVIVGWWNGFPFYLSFAICVSGGILGVLFTIPLRRALVTHSDLPYPEGVAAAEVLKVGSQVRAGSTEGNSDSRQGLLAVVLGTIASAGLSLMGAIQIAALEISGFFRIGSVAASGYSISWSLALFGAGHLVGLSVGLAMLAGLAIAWVGAVPILTHFQPVPEGMDLAAHTLKIWKQQVRFLGAGTIGVSALWTLGTLMRSVTSGLIASFRAANPSREQNPTDQDLSPRWMIFLAVVCLGIAAWLSLDFTSASPLAAFSTSLTLQAIPFIVIAGFLIAAVCGYMAGLIGASNSPISGVGILAIVGFASLLSVFFHPAPESRSAFVAYGLFITAIVFACATISNDNLQDLKTGQLVGASPKKQQIALIVGVIVGAAVIPPTLNLLARAYGFAGAPNVATISANPLPAPQATLISALAQGVLGGSLDWKMITLGAGIGVALIALNGILGMLGKTRIPPLAVGIGIYLPMSVTFAVVLGAVIGHFYLQWSKRRGTHAQADRLGTLIASGMIVGESLFGVLQAGLIVATSKEAPLAVVSTDVKLGPVIGFLSFCLCVVGLYRWLHQQASRSAE